MEIPTMTSIKKTEKELMEEFFAKGGKAKVFEPAKPIYKAAETLLSTDTRRTDKNGNIINHNDNLYLSVGGSVSSVVSMCEI